MKKKTIKATHIDNCSHGYLSVSKKDIQLLDIPVTEFSSYSGHTLTRMYLEEDQDASIFMRYAELSGYKVEVKSGYNPNFSIKHNYNSNLFSYLPQVGDHVELTNGGLYAITVVDSDGIRVRMLPSGGQYRISISNPYQYIAKLESTVDQRVKSIQTA